MRKYNRDIEARYPKEVTLASMLKEHLDMQPENMEAVHNRLLKEENK